MPLPTRLMVCAGYNRYVIFTCHHVNTMNVILKTVTRPSFQFSGCLEGDGTVVETGEYINERVGGDKTYYKMVATKLNRWLKVGSEKIYEYTVEKPCLTLPIEYHSVYTGKDTTETWHLLVKPLPVPPVVPVRRVLSVRDVPPVVPVRRVLPVPPVPPVTQSKLPTHVLKGFVDGLIAAKESCPVTMEELSLGNIAMTGCYHAFERGAVQQIMNTSRLCPTCRSTLSAENIINF